MYVKKVKYFKDYKLKVLFSDDKTKIVDIEPIITKSKRVFKPLLDLDFFKQVSLDHPEHPLGIRWPNDADICPDVLYEMGVEVKKASSSSIISNAPKWVNSKIRKTKNKLSKAKTTLKSASTQSKKHRPMKTG